MNAFTSAELGYLSERRLARLATVGDDGVPHVTPVGMWSYDAEHDTIDITGRDFDRTKKYRDVTATGLAAIVIDDMIGTEPWQPRGVEVRGRAEAITDPHALIRIHPQRVISWGLSTPTDA